MSTPLPRRTQRTRARRAASLLRRASTAPRRCAAIGAAREPTPPFGPAGAARPRTAVRRRPCLPRRAGHAWPETHPHGPQPRPETVRARRRAGHSEAVEKSGASPARPAPLAPPPRPAAPAPTPGAAAQALTIRPAVAGDLAPLSFFFDTALRRDYFLRRGQLADMLRGGRHRLYVAEIDALLVGVAVTTRGARLVNALVHPAYRGLGIGRRLVEASAAREVRAKIDMSTGDPRSFYRSLGFDETGEDSGNPRIALMRR